MRKTLSLLFAVAGGIAISVQARITGALSIQLDDATLAAAVTFGSGLVLMILANALSRRNRAGVILLVQATMAGKFPWIFIFSGVLGAFAVYGQALTVEIVGVALFSLVFITGQMFASALLDTVGWVPAGRQHLGVARMVGLVAALAGVVLALLPKLSQSQTPNAEVAPGGLGTGGPLLVLLPLLLVFFAGLLQPPQMAMNGVMAAYAGQPGPLVLFNYLTGTLALVVLASPQILAGGLARLPLEAGDWWYYTGGLLGSVVVISGAILTRTIGSLLFTLGLVAGQLAGSLCVDLIWPIPGAVVAWQTFMGALVTLLALLVASISRLKS